MRKPTLPSRLLSRAGVRPRRGDGPAAGPDRRLVARVAALEAAVASLEEAVQESRQLNQRLADVVDVVTEVLVPAADRDDERLRSALANLNRTLDHPPADPD